MEESRPVEESSKVMDAPSLAMQRCPRCGYDLSGHVSTWAEQCPIAGVCSECGLEFAWGSLLNSRLRRLKWLYEHATRWWGLRCAGATALRALFPWRFWSRIRLHHLISVRRLLLWAPLLLGAIYGVVAMFVVFAGLAAMTASPPAQLNLRFALTRGLNQMTRLVATVSADSSQVEVRDPATGAARSFPVPAYADGNPSFYDTELGKLLIVEDNHFGNWSIEERPDPSQGPVFLKTPSQSPAPAWHNTIQALIAPDGAEHQRVTIVTLHKPHRIVSSGARSMIVDPLSRINLWLAAPQILLAVLGFSGLGALIVLVCPSEWRTRNVRVVHLLRLLVYSLTIGFVIIIANAALFVWWHSLQTWWLISGGGVWFPGATLAPQLPGWTHVLFTEWFAVGAFASLALWLSVYWWFGLRRGIELAGAAPLWFFVTVAGVLGMLISVVVPGYGMLFFF